MPYYSAEYSDSTRHIPNYYLLYSNKKLHLVSEKNPGLATSFSAIMEIRYAEASARLPATTELMTATTPEVVRHDDSSFHYYVIIVILTVVILTCFIAAFVCFYRRKKKNELLISYVVNPNSTLTQNGQPMQESTNTVSKHCFNLCSCSLLFKPRRVEPNGNVNRKPVLTAFFH